MTSLRPTEQGAPRWSSSPNPPHDTCGLGRMLFGKIIRLGDAQTPAQVIGVVQDTRTVVLGRVEPLFVYSPAAADAPVDDVFVRTAGNGQASIGSGAQCDCYN